jgi:hypothetical protein
VATGMQMPSETIDLRGNVPKLIFSDADRAYLANPNNYYWAFTMEHQDRSKANEWALETDGNIRLRRSGAARRPFRRAPDRPRRASPELQPELQLGGDHPAVAGR